MKTTTPVDLVDTDQEIVLAHSRHRCPNYCHRCSDLVAIVRERGGDVKDADETTMPCCWGGLMYGLDGCYCWPKVEREMRTLRKKQDLEKLRRLVRAFPEDARAILNEPSVRLLPQVEAK